MISDILQSANRYATGMEHVVQRRAMWLEKHKEVHEHLKEVAAYLDKNSSYQAGYFVDVLHAYNESMNGTCADMPSISFRCGDMPMHVSFHNNLGENTEYLEDGFRITFNPTITGIIVVLLAPHKSELNKDSPPYITLAVIDDPARLSMEVVDKIIAKGIEAAFHTSYTGMSENVPETGQPEQHHPFPQHQPIGFKRYETTEKVK